MFDGSASTREGAALFITESELPLIMRHYCGRWQDGDLGGGARRTETRRRGNYEL